MLITYDLRSSDKDGGLMMEDEGYFEVLCVV